MLHSTTSSSTLSFMLPHQVSEDPSAIQPFLDITLQHHMLVHIRYSNIHFHRVTYYSSTHFSRLIQPFIVIHAAIHRQLVCSSMHSAQQHTFLQVNTTIYSNTSCHTVTASQAASMLQHSIAHTVYSSLHFTRLIQLY